ncbi:hypothetical protein, partial [Staphylococcus aureus]
MGNHFQYAFENKRYHTWNYHLKNKFGHEESITYQPWPTYDEA